MAGGGACGMGRCAVSCFCGADVTITRENTCMFGKIVEKGDVLGVGGIDEGKTVFSLIQVS